MPRDYAKSQHKEAKPLPGWLWLVTGLVIGLFIALLVYIKQNSSGKTVITDTMSRVFQPKQTDTRDVKTAPPEPPPSKPVESSKPKFDFYTILPELEVAIPEQDLVPEKTPSKTLPETKLGYMLQAGSFRQFGEADRLKARLALQGIEASIQTVKINDQDTWHRVRIGPLDNLTVLNQTRARLRKLGIATIVVKNKS